MTTPDLWTFSSAPAQRSPQVLLVAFSQGPLAEDVPLSLSRFGLPDAAQVEALDVRTISRASNPSWFEGWRRGALRVIAEGDLGDAIAELDASDHAHVVLAQPEAPTDLGYLQAAWGMVRYLVARGATIVLDAHAATYRLVSDLPAAGAPMDPDFEIRLVYETDSTRGDQAHALHTRGLRKFGAPDIVALCRDDDARLVAEVVRQVAALVAHGGDLASPRHGIDLDDTTAWYAVEDEHGLADLLQLNNTARVLVDEHGQDLTGVVARLRARQDAS